MHLIRYIKREVLKTAMETLFEIQKDSIRYDEEWEALYTKNNQRGVLNREGDVPFLVFPDLEEIPFVRHGFSTRLGGVSEGCLGTMNLSYQRGDKAEHVTENYHRICRAMGFEAKDLVLSDQVHDTRIYRAGVQDKQGIHLEEKKLHGIDGLITNVPGVVLTTSYADCVPLYFVDSEKRAIGLSHGGWKGTLGRIGQKTVEEMKKAFGTVPENLTAVIGPSICRSCYEVSQDVAKECRIALGAEQAKKVLKEKGDGKFQLDLWRTNQIILEEAGIPRGKIGVSAICTCCNHKLLYSHRASGGNRGNLSAFLTII